MQRIPVDTEIRPVMTPAIEALLAKWPGAVDVIYGDEQCSPSCTRYCVAIGNDGRTVMLGWKDSDRHTFSRDTGQCIESSDGSMKGWMIAPHEMHRYNAWAAVKYLKANDATPANPDYDKADDMRDYANAIGNGPISSQHSNDKIGVKSVGDEGKRKTAILAEERLLEYVAGSNRDSIVITALKGYLPDDLVMALRKTMEAYYNGKVNAAFIVENDFIRVSARAIELETLPQWLVDELQRITTRLVDEPETRNEQWSDSAKPQEAAILYKDCAHIIENGPVRVAVQCLDDKPLPTWFVHELGKLMNRMISDPVTMSKEDAPSIRPVITARDLFDVAREQLGLPTQVDVSAKGTIDGEELASKLDAAISQSNANPTSELEYACKAVGAAIKQQLMTDAKGIEALKRILYDGGFRFAMVVRSNHAKPGELLHHVTVTPDPALREKSKPKAVPAA